MPSFADKGAALQAATSAKILFSCNEKIEKAFKDLRHALVTPPIFAFLDFQKPFFVEKDASAVALGAVLSQRKED